jgi:hypothetical protein
MLMSLLEVHMAVYSQSNHRKIAEYSKCLQTTVPIPVLWITCTSHGILLENSGCKIVVH